MQYRGRLCSRGNSQCSGPADVRKMDGPDQKGRQIDPGADRRGFQSSQETEGNNKWRLSPGANDYSPGGSTPGATRFAAMACRPNLEAAKPCRAGRSERLDTPIRVVVRGRKRERK